MRLLAAVRAVLRVHRKSSVHSNGLSSCIVRAEAGRLKHQLPSAFEADLTDTTSCTGTLHQHCPTLGDAAKGWATWPAVHRWTLRPRPWLRDEGNQVRGFKKRARQSLTPSKEEVEMAESRIRQSLEDRVRPDDAPIRLVSDEGHRVMSYGKALRIAEKQGVDLLEVAPTARPPVCKLGNREQMEFEAKKKQKEVKRKQLDMRRAQTVKEVRVGAKIAENDMQLKLRAAQSFLEQGHRVRLTITFNRHQRLEGGQRLQEFVRLVQPFAQVSTPSGADRAVGNTFALLLTPFPDSRKAAPAAA